MSEMVVQSVGSVRTQIRTGVVRRHTINDVTNRQIRDHFQRPLMGISSMQTRRFSVCYDENNNDYIMRSQFSGYSSDTVGIVFPVGRRLRKRNGVKDDGQHRSMVSTILLLIFDFQLYFSTYSSGMYLVGPFPIGMSIPVHCVHFDFVAHRLCYFSIQPCKLH